MCVFGGGCNEVAFSNYKSSLLNTINVVVVVVLV